MLNQDVYITMIDNNECWIVYADGAALLIGSVNTAVALEC